MKFLYICSILFLFLFSCNCHHEGNGYVYDRVTGKPIENARIEVHSGVPGKDTLSPAVYTDRNGYYEYSHDFCKELISIYKKDYISFTHSSPQGDTSYLDVLLGN